jgi:hypothetical protein
MPRKLSQGAMKWGKALKEFNKSRSSWLIPKKGSKEYLEVRKIYESMP